MKRVVLFVVGLIALSLGTVHARMDWTMPAKALLKSVVTIERNDDGVSCTGFVINASAGEKGALDYVLTANHCFAEKMYADQTEAKVVARNAEKDLMVLVIADSDKPALKLAKESPEVGDEVASLGYGYGLEKPLFRISHISAELNIPYQGIGGPYFLTDATFVGGMSGGPVVNAAGEVVMIVQRGTDYVGMGVGAETLKNKVGKYWEKPAAKESK